MLLNRVVSLNVFKQAEGVCICAKSHWAWIHCEQHRCCLLRSTRVNTCVMIRCSRYANHPATLDIPNLESFRNMTALQDALKVTAILPGAVTDFNTANPDQDRKRRPGCLFFCFHDMFMIVLYCMALSLCAPRCLFAYSCAEKRLEGAGSSSNCPQDNSSWLHHECCLPHVQDILGGRLSNSVTSFRRSTNKQARLGHEAFT